MHDGWILYSWPPSCHVHGLFFFYVKELFTKARDLERGRDVIEALFQMMWASKMLLDRETTIFFFLLNLKKKGFSLFRRERGTLDIVPRFINM